MKRLPLLIAIITFIGGTWLIKPVGAQAPSLTLNWTAPESDSGFVGTAPVVRYWMRYSTTPYPEGGTAAQQEAWWVAATDATPTPTPKAPGQPESMTIAPVGGFLGGQTYTFVLKSRDVAGNVSGPSNRHKRTITIIDVIRPAPVLDLRTQ